MKHILTKIFVSFFLASIILSGICVSAVERTYILPSTTHEKAPVENIFQLKGYNDKFILLDDDENGFFVLMGKYCTTRAYSLDGKPVPFDPTDENNIGYWLNETYLFDETISNRLPQVVIDNLVEHTYVTEGGGSKVPFKADYSVTCKVVLLSQTEWTKYNNKFGYADDSSSAYWYLRSVRDMTGAPLVACVSAPNSGLTAEGKWTSNLGIRPAFYLPHDFFDKVAIDTTKTGDAVIAAIRKHSSTKKTVKLYNSTDMLSLYSSSIPPTAKNVKVIGRAIVGEALQGSYQFESLDGQPEKGTIVQWLKSMDGINWTTILGANSLTYVPTQADIGYNLTMRVTPMTQTDSGASIDAVPLNNKIRIISKPIATDIRIIGKYEAGYRIEALYDYSDENRDLCSGTDYIWESSKDKKNISQIGSGRYYKLTGNESGCFVRVKITPNKLTNSDDGRQTVNGESAYSEWIEINSLPEIQDVKLGNYINSAITIDKNKDGFDISGFIGLKNDSARVITSDYDILGGTNYTIQYDWERSDKEYGLYESTGCTTANYTVKKDDCGWYRLKVYAIDNEGRKGMPCYSKSEYITKNSPDITPIGSEQCKMEVKNGRMYEVWVINTNTPQSYSFTMSAKGISSIEPISDEYIISSANKANEQIITGSRIGTQWAHDKAFKAFEFTALSDDVITLSEAYTVGIDEDNNILQQQKACIFISEK